MENDFGTLTELSIRFQEAVISACDQCKVDANHLSEEEWNDFYGSLTEENFDNLVREAVDTASKFQEIVVAFADYNGF